MRKLNVVIIILALVGISPGFARGGMHGRSMSGALSAPANPSVPPSLTPDARLTGSAPLPLRHRPVMADSANVKPDPEDAKVDRIVRSICRGC
jgi:hypothetical protein